MSVKQDFNSLYASEYKQYKTLMEKETPLTTSGSLTFTSLSSGQTYTSASGEMGLLTSLQTVLKPYIVGASDFNAKTENTDFNAHTSDNTAHNLGTATLTTTDKTVKGAINEVNSGVNYLKGNNPNLLKESSFQFGGMFWTDGSTGKFVPTNNYDGYFLTCSTAPTSAITYTSTSIPANANVTFTVSADFWTGGLTGAGNFYILLQAYNGGTFLSNICTLTPTKGVSSWVNFNGTGTTPTNTTQIYVSIVMDANTVNTNASVRRIKVEYGSTKTPYSQEHDIRATYTSALHLGINPNTDGYFDNSTTNPTGITRLNYSGYLYATRIYNAGYYGDYAEYFKKGSNDLEYGDVISLNINSEEEVYVKSNGAYDRNVVGVYSDDYAQCLGGEGKETDDEKFASVGMAGTVRVKAIGNIKKSDLLVSSEIPGVAMSEQTHIPGTVFAKALEDHEGNSIDRIRAIILNC